MNRDQAEKYTEGISDVIKGAYKLTELGEELAVPSILKLSSEEWREKRLLNPVKWSRQQRQELVKEGARAGLSQRKMAKLLDVDESTVRADLRGAGNPAKRAGNPAKRKKKINPKEEEAIKPVIQRIASEELEKVVQETIPDRVGIEAYNPVTAKADLEKVWFTVTEYCDDEWKRRFAKDLMIWISNMYPGLEEEVFI